MFTWIWVTLNGKFYGHISCMHSLHGLICYIMIYNDKIYRYEHNICVNNIEYQMISSGFPLWDSNRTPIQQCSIFHDRGVPSFVLDPLPHLPPSSQLLAKNKSYSHPFPFPPFIFQSWSFSASGGAACGLCPDDSSSFRTFRWPPPGAPTSLQKPNMAPTWK